MRTIEKVEDFSHIRQSYLNNLSLSTLSTKKRREKLMEDHYFLCECTRCMDTKSDKLMVTKFQKIIFISKQ